MPFALPGFNSQRLQFAAASAPGGMRMPSCAARARLARRRPPGGRPQADPGCRRLRSPALVLAGSRPPEAAKRFSRLMHAPAVLLRLDVGRLDDQRPEERPDGDDRGRCRQAGTGFVGDQGCGTPPRAAIPPGAAGRSAATRPAPARGRRTGPPPPRSAPRGWRERAEPAGARVPGSSGVPGWTARAPSSAGGRPGQGAPQWLSKSCPRLQIGGCSIRADRLSKDSRGWRGYVSRRRRSGPPGRLAGENRPTPLFHPG